MMLYCPQNVTFSDVWIDNGLSQCFIDTISVTALALFLLLFGTGQAAMYRKHGTQIPGQTLQKSLLYNLQLSLAILIPILAVTRFFLQTFLYHHGNVYGFTVVSLLLTTYVYIFSLWLLHCERHYLLPSVPPRGHGAVLLIFWTLAFTIENMSFLSFSSKSWWFHLTLTSDKIEMALFVARYLACFANFVLGIQAPGINHYPRADDSPLIREGSPVAEGSTFRNVWKKLALLFPFLWPKKDCVLQVCVLLCVMLLISGRVINLYVPVYSKLIVNSMSGSNLEFRSDLVLLYVFFKFLQGGGTGGMGLLNNLRSFLWIRIQQYTTREIQLELFSHLHSLSLRWHVSRKTGEVLRVMDRGTDSIFNLLNYILFSIVPTIIDIIVAVVFFVIAFNAWFGVIVFLTMSLYIIITIAVTEWRTKYQRSMNLADNAQKARSVDSLLNFETVKYYGAEKYEVQCFREAIMKYQEEEWKSNATLNILNTLQNIIVCSGLLAGSLYCVYLVVHDKGLTVGDYVLFASYIIQLYVPLNWFGTYYRLIQKNFIDMENMLDLLKEDQEVTDAPGASPLVVKGGAVEFYNVSFSYVPERVVLKNVSFKAPAGATIALVGPSGSGKSTIMRLLFRFYDISDGAIIIDGQNIAFVTQESLRKAVGVVPQDTVLFNNTIKFNIEYGCIGSSESEIIAAAQYADIHHKIMTFPDRYDTQVGERGLKLSGGEKQRVAIARTILKSPAVVLLDEATSALDTQTERNIQDALARVCANRTTIIIAHRLSTIIHADEILVLTDGEIVERGSHRSLLEQNGVYASMWQQQLKNEETARVQFQESSEKDDVTWIIDQGKDLKRMLSQLESEDADDELIITVMTKDQKVIESGCLKTLLENDGMFLRMVQQRVRGAVETDVLLFLTRQDEPVESGTHDGLLSGDSEYAKVWKELAKRLQALTDIKES